MSIIKKPAEPPKIVSLEVQIEQPIIDTLDRYAEFIQTSREHIVASALRLVFKKDYDFKRWLRSQTSSDSQATPRTAKKS
jgi:hypothetical protein